MIKIISCIGLLLLLLNVPLSGQGLVSQWERLPKILPAPDRPSGGGFGFSVDMHGDFALVGAPLNSLNGEEAGMAFIFKRENDAWELLARLEPSDALFGDQFGFDVALTDSYAVVSSRFGTGGQAFSGAAYVFERPASGWADMKETAKLVPSDPEPLMLFGHAVAAEGSLILVGAVHKDQSIGEFFGRGYLYERSGERWESASETAQLSASDRSRGDRLGFSVALGDGTAFLATPLQNAQGNVNAGSVYVYEPSGSWGDMTESGRIFSPDLAANSQFGASLAYDNGSLVVGSPNHLLESGARAGRAYIFEADGTDGWSSAQLLHRLSPIDPLAGEEFSRSLSISGGMVAVTSLLYAKSEDERGRVTLFAKGDDGGWDSGTLGIVPTPDNDRGDSYAVSVALWNDRLLVGASSDSDNPSEAIRAGAVQFFEVPDGSLPEMAFVDKIHHPVLSSDPVSFGLSISLDSTVAVIGVPYSNYATRRGGAAFVYAYDGEEWELLAGLTASDPGEDELFGYDVAISGNTIVVGSVIHNEIGAAYVFERPPGGWKDTTETAKLTTTDPGNLLLFGYKVDVEGETVVVATPEAFERGVLSGAVYVYERPEGGWTDGLTETVKIYPPIRTDVQRFGQSVDLYKDQIIVGATGHDDRRINEGAAYIYTKPPSGWQDVDLANPVHLFTQTAYTNFNFGYGVALTDTYAAVGAPNNDFNGRNNGAVYVFEKGDDGWESGHEAAIMFASDAGLDDAMGFSVMAQDDLIMAGAPNNNHTGNNSGAAYVFRKPANGWRNLNQEAKVFPFGGFQQSNFGWSIGLSDGFMIAGSPREDNDLGSRVGAVYTYVNLGLIASTPPTAPQGQAPSFAYTAYLRPDGQMGLRLASGRFPDRFQASVIDLTGRLIATQSFAHTQAHEVVLQGGFRHGEPYVVQIMVDGVRLVKKVVLF